MRGRYALLHRFALATLALSVLLAACAGHRIEPIPAWPLHTVQVDDAQLAYRVAGTGPPLLLIMGYAGTMDIWDATFVARLAKTRRVILFDNRNMGHSTASDASASMERMARDTLGLIQALGLDRPDVLGWSMGSIIAQEMALARPDAVGKLVLYGSACEAGPVLEAVDRMRALSHERFMAELFPAEWARRNSDVFARLPNPALPPSPEALASQREGLRQWAGTTDRLPGLRGPVLLLVGEEDAITLVQQSVTMAGLIRGAWLARFDGGGHWLMYQNPEAMADVVETFLRTRQDLLD
ncbi:alpha/beta fold hydrolase [Pseudodesulfovibrio sp. F-1]|uniref:Alpha/beta fold hydrolase n=1 Tax=Pseudodesulfovibrio alkaliphilus TaxID=2661613 RepID=A0A7K1KRC5_9BACT|nr:alpha/beta hydrolase [Pseudodesulfovibrio alkaliphilus]MUM78643.1 alpha/beta fold hydrolase [Pseudodesulfovibrio alkaliphilus]